MEKARWIKAPTDTGSACVTFSKKINTCGGVVRATLEVSAVGVYVAYVNQKRVGDRVLTPGFTSYNNRVMYQTYDVTTLLGENNILAVTVGPGWAVGKLGFTKHKSLYDDHVRATACLTVEYNDGACDVITTDETWETWTDKVTFSDIYDGETIDMTHEPRLLGNAVADDDRFPVVPDEGEPITEQEILAPASLIVTPKGERVLDFGQNMTGYVSLQIKGNKGERVVLSHAEVLDSEGNFYNANYRDARNILTFVLSGGDDFFKPQFSFQGFRYVRIDEYPDGDIDVEGFRAVVVHSDMERIGHFTCGDAKINQLYHNIIWGQKSNYLDIPTDCPQRNERLGWTGDAQVFCRVGGINYDVSRFFAKWLSDLRLEQEPDGAIYGTCPEAFGMHNREHSRIATGWGDVVTIAPWTMYELYGDKKVLEDNFEMMCRWVGYMRSAGPEEYLWLGGYHYGDWLAMDAGGDTYVGATSDDLIASAYFAYSTELVIKAGKVLGKDVTEYQKLYENVVSAFRARFMKDGLPLEVTPPEVLNGNVKTGMTQTAITLILHFGLYEENEREGLINKLEELIHGFGDRMSTGFLGTPYILHVLSSNGKQELAYKLLFNEDNPSWLYSVNHGATTMWEHWNSIKEDGSFWSTDMNSFNHYAYGAVGDWLYGVVSGIKINDGGAGYKSVTLAPVPCERLGFARSTVKTPCGVLESYWYYTGDRVRFEFTVPCGTVADIVLPGGYKKTVSAGVYHFEI